MSRMLSLAGVLAAGLLLAACSSWGGPGRELQGEWQLVEAADDQGTMDLKGSTVTMWIEQDSARSDGPCNILQFEIRGGPGDVEVTLGPITERACLDQDLMVIESRYVETLGTVTTAAVEGDTLTLTGDGGHLTYLRQADSTG